MKFLNSKTAGLMADTLCGILLSAAACMALFSLLQYGEGFGSCLLFVLTDFALIVIFTRKWWILPALIAAGALLTALAAWLLGSADETFGAVAAFFRWCAQPYHDAAPDDVSAFLWRLIIALPVCLAVFAYFRKLFCFPPLPFVSAALLVWVYLHKTADVWYVLIALLFVVFVSDAKARGARISRDGSEGISSAMLSVSAVIVMPVVLLAAFLCAPQKDGDWQCKPFVNAVQDIGDYLGIGDGRLAAGGSFSLTETGFSPLEQRLGGNVTVSNKLTLKVKTDTPVCLAGAVFNTYDGKSWYDSQPLERFRYTNFIWQGKRNEAFDIGKPSDGRMRELFGQISKSVEMEVECRLQGRTLFAAGRLQELTGEKPDTADVFFNNQAELFTLKPYSSLMYRFRTVVADRKADRFDTNMRELERLAEDCADEGWDAAAAEYLQLPDTLPQSVYDAAEEAAQGCETPYEKAAAIEKWLADNCVYTLTPGTPDDGDFVASFLKQKKGYCVYFASAMTVMARCLGLPARYVIGFALQRSPLSDANNAYVATNATAHAWTEVYFKGIGWMPFDATNWDSDDEAVIESGLSQSGSGYIPQPLPAPSPSAVISGVQTDSRSGGIPLAAVVSLLCVSAAIALIALIRYLGLFAKGYYGRLCRKYDNAGDKLNACYAKVIRQAAFLGVRRQPSDTIQTLARRIDDALDNGAMSDVCRAVEVMRFGQKEPSEQDVKRMCEFSLELERLLRVKLGFRGYLWRRILRLPGGRKIASGKDKP